MERVAISHSVLFKFSFSSILRRALNDLITDSFAIFEQKLQRAASDTAGKNKESRGARDRDSLSSSVKRLVSSHVGTD